MLKSRYLLNKRKMHLIWQALRSNIKKSKRKKIIRFKYLIFRKRKLQRIGWKQLADNRLESKMIRSDFLLKQAFIDHNEFFTVQVQSTTSRMIEPT